MSNDTPPVPIAFCITELDRGGAERALTQLVLGLDRSAWNPRVYCLGPRGHFAEILEQSGITVECLDGGGFLSFPRVLRQLTWSLRQFRPALVQTFLFHGNLVGRLAAWRASIPVVVSGIRVAERRSRWYGRIDRWTNGLVKHNVCVSQGVADFAVREMGLDANKVSVIPNGVDFELFASAAPVDLTSIGLRPQDPVVITVGRLEEQKGIRYLLSAAVDVLHAKTNCQFLIVGDGTDRRLLEEQAKSLGIATAVHFVGPQSNIAGLMKASTLFVLPSLWEGMPNALLEAMAAGLPAIATSVEGSSEVIESGVTGFLVQPANAADLSAAILRLLDDPNLSVRIAESAQVTVEKRFAICGVVAAYDGLYRRLLSPS